MSRLQLSFHVRADARTPASEPEQEETYGLPPDIVGFVQGLRPGDVIALRDLLLQRPDLTQQISALASHHMGSSTVNQARSEAYQLSRAPQRSDEAPKAEPATATAAEGYKGPLNGAIVREQLREAGDLAPEDQPLHASAASHASTEDAKSKPPLRDPDGGIPVGIINGKFNNESFGKGAANSDDALQNPVAAAPDAGHAEAEHDESEQASSAAPHSGEGPSHGRVTAKRLNVRQSPSAQSRANVIGQLNHGDEVKTVSHEGAWIKIAHQGQHAYVHGNYVDTKPAKKSAPEHVEAKPVGPAVDPAAKVATPPEVIKAVKHAAPEVAPQVEAQAKKPLAEVQAQSQTSGNQESTTAAATPESSSTETPAPAEHRQELEAEAARLLKEFDAGNLDHLGAVQRFTAFDEKATGHQTKAGQDVLLALIGALSEHEIRRKAAVAKANDE